MGEKENAEAHAENEGCEVSAVDAGHRMHSFDVEEEPGKCKTRVSASDIAPNQPVDNGRKWHTISHYRCEIAKGPPRMDRLTSLEVFVRVHQEGSISAAARALHMSQTMATKHLAGLEARLGAQLMHRSTRRITLTEAGRRYLESAERILADLEESESQVTRDHLKVQGLLRINAPVSFGIRSLAPALADFSARYPDVTIDLGLNDRYVDLVEEGWDLAIRIGNLPSSALIARRLAPCETILCASPRYLEENGHPRTVAGLETHNCLGYTLSRSIGVDTWAFGRTGKVKTRIKGTLRANNGDALLAAAAAGLGIIIVPRFLAAEALATGRVVEVTLDEPSPELGGIYAVYPAERRPPAKVRAFIDFMAARMANDKVPEVPGKRAKVTGAVRAKRL